MVASGDLWVKSCHRAGGLEVVAFPLSLVLTPSMPLIKVTETSRNTLCLSWEPP